MIHQSYLPTFPLLTSIRQAALAHPDDTVPALSGHPASTNAQLCTALLGIATRLLSARLAKLSRARGRPMMGGAELQGARVGVLVVSGSGSEFEAAQGGRRRGVGAEVDLWALMGTLGAWAAGASVVYVTVPVPVSTNTSTSGSTSTSTTNHEGDDDQAGRVARALMDAGVEMLLYPSATSGDAEIHHSFAKYAADLQQRSAGLYPVEVELDFGREEAEPEPEPEEERSYTTHPPIWMIRQWEENAPSEDPRREAAVWLDLESGSRPERTRTHADLDTLVGGDQCAIDEHDGRGQLVLGGEEGGALDEPLQGVLTAIRALCAKAGPDPLVSQ